MIVLVGRRRTRGVQGIAVRPKGDSSLAGILYDITAKP
jgi:hypothetical protein